MKEKPRPIRRAELAEDVERPFQSIIRDLNKIPSFKGKARFVDKVLAAHIRSHNLAWDLRYDSEESPAHR